MAKKILVVDDDTAITTMMQFALKANGYDGVFANDAQDALKKARKEKPDLIILDIMMPDMDGTELNMALKEDSVTKEIPVIFLTGIIQKNEEQVDEDARNIVLSKPFQIHDLLSKIKEVIGS